MSVDVFVRKSLFLQYIECGNQHSTSTHLRLDKFLSTEQKILKHFELMFIEREVIRVCFSIRCLVESRADNIGNIGNLATIFLIVFLQEVVAVCGFGQKTLTDNHIYLLGCNRDALLETVNNLCEQTAVYIGAIDDIIQLKLRNGNSPHLASEGGYSFCHSFKVKDIDFLLGNCLAYLVNHEYDANISILFNIAGQVFLKLYSIIVLYAQFCSLTHFIVSTLRTEAVNHGVL